MDSLLASVQGWESVQLLFHFMYICMYTCTRIPCVTIICIRLALAQSVSDHRPLEINSNDVRVLQDQAYSFDLDEDTSRVSYNKFFVCYLKTFERLGLKAIPMAAETGPIGGDMSHEFVIISETGESDIFYDNRILDLLDVDQELDYTKDLSSIE